MQDNKRSGGLTYRPATQAVRAGQQRTHEQEHSEPIFTTSSFIFDSAEQAAARFAGDEKGNVYSRFTNPTVAGFERRLAAMEGGDACVATASGMSALLAVCLTGLESGDHVVASESIFGASQVLLNNLLKRFKVECSFVRLSDLDQWQQALQSNTKMVFFETPSNPLMELGDIAAISELVHHFNADIKVVVDNCFCTPALQQPLLMGADVILHSATKFIDGQGRCMGGAIVGDDEFVGKDIVAYMRTAGPALSPFNAWVFNKGLETLTVRMQQACQNAAEIASWLESQTTVKRVHYPGLRSHPQYELARKQQTMPGAVVSFEVTGDQASAWQLINRTELLSITANLGDTRTTITHPFSTTHARLSDEDKQRSGITTGLLRLAVGLEDWRDIVEDLHF